MSITDGTFVCGLCGEWVTGCSLCGVAPLTDRRAAIAAEIAQERAADRELDQQSRSIKWAAWNRRTAP